MAEEKTTPVNETKPDPADKSAESSAAPNKSAKKSKAAAELEKVTGELEKVKAELESAKDMLMRTAAEFDNYKKRTEREKTSIAEYGKAALIKEILPLIDNASRAANADSSAQDYAKGLEMIVKQLLALISKLSIETLAEPGDEFDPNLHDAVMHVDDESVGENVIVEILQQGYRYGDTVIRPAMVKVAN